MRGAIPVTSKDEEVRSVIAELDAKLDLLRVTVGQLSAILTPPAQTGPTNGEEVPVG